MSPQTNNFAVKVKNFRKKLGMSQEKLAKALGVSFATVNRWENSKTKPSKLAQNQFEHFCQNQEQRGI